MYKLSCDSNLSTLLLQVLQDWQAGKRAVILSISVIIKKKKNKKQKNGKAKPIETTACSFNNTPVICFLYAGCQVTSVLKILHSTRVLCDLRIMLGNLAECIQKPDDWCIIVYTIL